VDGYRGAQCVPVTMSLTVIRRNSQVIWEKSKPGEARYTHVEDSRSVKSAKCVRCHESINKGERRISLPRKTKDLGKKISLPPYINAWYHCDCFWEKHRATKYRRPYVCSTGDAKQTPSLCEK